MSVGKVETFSYGPHSEQFFRLSSPASENPKTKVPVIVIFHGGFWKEKYNLDNAAIETLRPYFLSNGNVVCEVEYRRREHEGGGYPGTNMDCVSALHLLYEKSKESTSMCDMSKVILLGHSAGGYLALWLCCSKAEYSPQLPFSPILCVAVSPVAILKTAHELRLGDEGDVVEAFMGCTPSEDEKDRYSKACPSRLLPLTVNCLLVTGKDDTDVPTQIAQEFYALAIKEKTIQELHNVDGVDVDSGIDINDIDETDLRMENSESYDMLVQLLEVEGADHYSLVNAKSSSWAQVINDIEKSLGVIDLI